MDEKTTQTGDEVTREAFFDFMASHDTTITNTPEYVWNCRCPCGWVAAPDERLSVVRAAFNGHVADDFVRRFRPEGS